MSAGNVHLDAETEAAILGFARVIRQKFQAPHQYEGVFECEVDGRMTIRVAGCNPLDPTPYHVSAVQWSYRVRTP